MRPVFRRVRALARLPAARLGGAWVGVGGSALVALPLFGVPGYELGSGVAIALALAGGAVGMAAAGDPSQPASAGRAFAAAALFNVACTLPPWAVATVWALAGSRCSPFAGLAFYPLLTFPTALLSAAAGVACAPGPTARGRAGRYSALLALSVVWSAWPLYFGPQVFAYNLFAGYLPGPLYDELLTVRTPLLWARAEALLAAAALALYASARQPGVYRRAAAGGAALCALAVGGLEAAGPRLGLSMNEATLIQRLGGERDTEHFHLVFPREKSAEQVERLARDAEFRYAQLAQFLGGAPEGRIRAFVYRTPEEKQALVGAAHTQFAKPWRLEFHINDGPFPSQGLKHELAHVMASRFGPSPFGVPTYVGVLPQMGLVEGLAVAADNPVGELTLHQWAAGMRREHLAPNLLALFSLRGFYASAAGRAYTSAGSFLRHLADTRGPRPLQALYRNGDFGQAYGEPLERLIAEWESFLDALPLDAAAQRQAFGRFRQGSVFARPCVREVAELSAEAEERLASQPDLALALYQRCSVISPEEPAFRLGQARALTALGRAKEALHALREAEGQVADRPALLADVLLAQADTAAHGGDFAGARNFLQRLLSLQPGGALERTALVKGAALAAPAARGALWGYFEPGHDTQKILALKEVLDQPPAGYAAYLLGRRLVQDGSPAQGRTYLRQALTAPLPDSLAREAQRLLAEADFLAGDCAALAPQPAGGMEAAEWQERCAFETREYKGPLVPAQGFR